MSSDPGNTLPWIAAIVVEPPDKRQKILTQDEGMDMNGNGESRPVDTKANPAGKVNNRRVAFIKK